MSPTTLSGGGPVVTTLEAAPLYEAEHFCEVLRERGFHLGALVLNKTLPDSLRDPAGAAAATACIDDAGPISDALVGTRAGGFGLTRQEATGKWGAATYALRRTGSVLVGA